MKTKRNQRILYLILGLVLTPIAAILTVGSIAQLGNSEQPLWSNIIVLIIAYILLAVSFWLLRKWYVLGYGAVLSEDIVAKSILSIPGVLQSIGESENKNGGVLSFDADNQMIRFFSKENNVELEWGQVNRLFIKNYGMAVNQTVFLDTEKGKFSFYLVKNPASLKVMKKAHSLGLLGVVVGPLGLLAGVTQAIFKQDSTLVYPSFDLNFLYYWLKKNEGTFIVNKMPPSMVGVLFISLLPLIWFFGALIILQTAKALGTSDNAANAFGVLGGFLPLIAVVLINLRKTRSYL